MAVLTETATKADKIRSTRKIPAAATAASADAIASPDASAATDDDKLLQAIASGDENAYATIVHRHADRIYGYLLRLTGSRPDAEDLLQDTFFRIWRSARTYQPNRVQAGTWITRIAHNACIDSFRRRRPAASVTLDALETATPEQLRSADLESVHIARDALSAVEAQIARLPENQRAALVLCRLQGFSNADAAIILGINVRALESLLARARRTLRQALETGDNDE